MKSTSSAKKIEVSGYLFKKAKMETTANNLKHYKTTNKS